MRKFVAGLVLVVALLMPAQAVMAEFHEHLPPWWERAMKTQMMLEKLMMQSMHKKMMTPPVLHISLFGRHFALTCAPSKALIVPWVSGGHPKPSPDPYEAPRNSRENAILESGLFSLWPKFPFFPAELRHTIPMRCTSPDESSRAR